METKQWVRSAIGLCLIASLAISCQKQEEVDETAESQTVDPRAELVAFVEMAATELEARGEAAFADFRQAGSKWFQGDRYLFVIDLEGNTLCHAANPDLEGTSLLDMQDEDGISPTREMLAVLESNEAGWISYKWPRPGATEASAKASYVMKAKLGDRVVAIGSGMYTEPEIAEK
ncbi:MAG: cache domain-containing protein [bacterium]